MVWKYLQIDGEQENVGIESNGLEFSWKCFRRNFNRNLARRNKSEK